LGRSIGADAALAWGLVSELVEATELAGRIDTIAAEVAVLPEAAVRLTKAAFRRELDDGLDAELDILAGQQGELLTSEEFRERAARFTKPPSPPS
jgi:enoyl-CoA hydratase/carnithine racemase